MNSNGWKEAFKCQSFVIVVIKSISKKIFRTFQYPTSEDVDVSLIEAIRHPMQPVFLE